MRNRKLKKGAPLPFAYDILKNAFLYSNRVPFTKYPSEISVRLFQAVFPWWNDVEKEHDL